MQRVFIVYTLYTHNLQFGIYSERKKEQLKKGKNSARNENVYVLCLNVMSAHIRNK